MVVKKAQFTVSADFVLNLAHCTERLHSQSYDVVVAEYASPSWKGPQAFQLLHQTVQEIPLLFVTTAIGSESIAQLTADGAFDYVEGEHLAQLPMAVRRVLNEKKLRAELKEAGKALRHSQSLYRALVENPAYGICRCDEEGKFLDVNQALLAMLGYETKEELLAANRACEVVLDLGPGIPLAGRFPETVRIDPVEIEWKRKNSTTLKARLSGRGVFDEHGDFNGYEIIAVDITEQRALEERLRDQAFSDSLTGLANHRRLFDVLQAEICRTK
jgi:PAS domain-containing protein